MLPDSKDLYLNRLSATYGEDFKWICSGVRVFKDGEVSGSSILRCTSGGKEMSLSSFAAWSSRVISNSSAGTGASSLCLEIETVLSVCAPEFSESAAPTNLLHWLRLVNANFPCGGLMEFWEKWLAVDVNSKGLKPLCEDDRLHESFFLDLQTEDRRAKKCFWIRGSRSGSSKATSNNVWMFSCIKIAIVSWIWKWKIGNHIISSTAE